METSAAQDVVGNVPVELTRLVGREHEVAELTALVQEARLVTLAGPGGAGKTRLALAVARAAAPSLAGGAWWADLADVAGDAFVGEAVVRAVEAHDLPARPAVETLALRLGAAPTLLVLDNCEQVVAGCAEVVDALLRRRADLTVLATSRQSLGVAAEEVRRIGGLDDGAPELFREAARRHGAVLRDDDATRAAIAAICSAVDGLPLGIELAAARAALLSPAEIAERLASDLGVLRGGARSVPPRQRSLEAALEWSHRLLSAGERAVLRRLAVFRGPFGLGDAEAVCAAGDVRREDVLDTLAGLVDQSLVQVATPDERDPGTRYRLLAVVRLFAERQLRESGELEATRAAHASHLVAFAEVASEGLAGPDQVGWLDRLDARHDNLRAALGALLAMAPEDGGRMAALLWPFWYRRGHYAEAREWLDRAADASGDMTAPTRAAVLAADGVVAFLQCDYALATGRLEAALVLHRELGQRRGVADALQRLGSIAREQGRYDEARELHDQSLALWRELGDELGVAASLDYLAFAAWLSGDLEAATELGTRALSLVRSAGARQETAAALVNLGAAAHYRGDRGRAAALLDEALTLSVESGYQEGIAWALNERALVAGRGHELSRAAEMLRESLSLHRGLGDRWRTVSVLEELAGALLARVEPQRAAALLGAAEAARERLGIPVPAVERADRDRSVRRLRRSLGAAEFEEAWAAGRELGLDEAATAAGEAAARVYGEDAAAEADRRQAEDLLTPREQAVLALVGDGRTNREIGAALFISPSTAGVHVSNILRKLGVRRRAQAAARAQQLGLLDDG